MAHKHDNVVVIWCVLCSQLSETIDHLLICCPFSREIWFKVLQWMGWEDFAPSTHFDSLADWWVFARKGISKEGRRCFDSLLVLTCWLLWKERNNRIFDRRVQTIDDVLARVADEVSAWSMAGFRQLFLVSSALDRRAGRDNTAM